MTDSELIASLAPLNGDQHMKCMEIIAHDVSELWEYDAHFISLTTRLNVFCVIVCIMALCINVLPTVYTGLGSFVCMWCL